MAAPPVEQAELLVEELRERGPRGPREQVRLLENFLRELRSRVREAALSDAEADAQLGRAAAAREVTRPATFIGLAEAPGGAGLDRAHVITPDGQERYPVLHRLLDRELLRPGVTVLLDAAGLCALATSGAVPNVGHEARFVTWLPEERVLVLLREERLVLRVSALLAADRDRGDVRPGDRLLCCPPRQFAFRLLGGAEERRQRFLDRARIPDVVVARDIGKPHPVLDWLIRRTRLLIFRPDLVERFGLRPRVSALLTGPSGTGKTLTINGYLHAFAQMVKERTGRDDVGSRVVRAQAPELLSKWFAESEQNIERLFADVLAVAAEEVRIASGEPVRLPVVLVLEEVDGLARRRSQAEDATGAAMDRILTTLLQRLDEVTDDGKGLPLVFLSTSNRADLIDPAMYRRLSGERAVFTRLGRDGVAAVLDKKLRPGFAYAAGAGRSAAEARRAVIEETVDWLAGRADENQAVLEVTLRDGRKLVKYRRDFLTGAVLGDAVDAAINDVVSAAQKSGGEPALDAAVLTDALRRQVDGQVGHLAPANVAEFVDLPDGAEPVAVRRLPSAAAPAPETF
jgi:hypothetical protein